MDGSWLTFPIQSQFERVARPHPALIELAAGRALPQIDDGGRLVASAMEHKMTGLLLSRLEQGECTLEPELERDLAAISLLIEDRHRRLTHALACVSERLQTEGIDVATFKGVAAELRWYDRIGERPCSDVDLLVAPHDLHRVGELVELLEPGHRMGGRTLQRLADDGALEGLDLRFDGVSIDVHFDLFKLGYPGRQPETVWSRTLPMTLPGGGHTRMLDPELSFVHLLLHLNRDKFRTLLGYADISRILDRESLDWDFITRFVRREGLKTQHALALGVVVDTLRLNVPDCVVPTGWRASIWRIAWRPKTRLLGELAGIRYMRRGPLLLPLLVHGRARDAVGYWFRRLFPPRAVVDIKHPGTRGPYLWRLLVGRLGQRRELVVKRLALRKELTRKSGVGW